MGAKYTGQITEFNEKMVILGISARKRAKRHAPLEGRMNIFFKSKSKSNQIKFIFRPYRSIEIKKKNYNYKKAKNYN